MADDIPQWAIEQAKRMFEDERKRANDCNYWEHWSGAFARYIAEHEEPPVDPLLIEARKVFGPTVTGFRASHCVPPGCLGSTGEDRATLLHEGRADDFWEMHCVLAALKRGMELAGERS